MVGHEFLHPSEAVADTVDLTRGSPPPQGYYAGHLAVVVRTVLKQYSDILAQNEIDFGQSILKLSNDAIRLFARLIGRKGSVILIDSLQYQEVDDRNSAIQELERLSLVETKGPVPADWVLARLKVSELKSTFPLVTPRTPKALYIDCIACRYPDSRIRGSLEKTHGWLEIVCQSVLDLYLLLFFGNRSTDLSAFVVRDLGIIRYVSYPLNRTERQFRSRRELNHFLTLSKLSEDISIREESLTKRVLLRSIEQLCEPFANRTLEHYRSRTLNQLGHLAERRKDLRTAIRAYRRSSSHPARERIVRILYRLRRFSAAKSMQNSISKTPWNLEEQQFARSFKKRKKPEDAFESTEMYVESLPQLPIEQYALNELTSEGGNGWHLENSLPLMLFGLAYWEWIFAPIPGAFTNQFQTGPHDLFWPEFFSVRSKLYTDPLESKRPISLHILENNRIKQGLANRLVNWSVFPQDTIAQIVEAMSEQQIRRLIGIVKRDLRQMRSGFPDLTIVYPQRTFEFVEVKGPNDQVQTNQRVWLNALANSGLPVRVVKFSCPQ